MPHAMQHPVVLEFDADAGHYTATVPGMPGIVVDAKTEKTALKLVAEAIAMYRKEHGVTISAKVVSVEV
jgi:predicted RNase H-like HicB family nuclease